MLVDERLAGVSPIARLVILGAAALADRNGILENRPLRIRVASFPHEPWDVSTAILELLSCGVFSMSEDERYLKIEPWNEWFSGFNREEEYHVTQPFSCGTPVEHIEAPDKVRGSLGQAPIKYKIKCKDKGETPKRITDDPGMQLVHCAFRHHPARKTPEGKYLSLGSRAKTLPRIVRIAKAEGMTLQDIEAVSRAYSDHPNVQQGYVQSVEVFWGESGHWLDIWTMLHNERRKQNERAG